MKRPTRARIVALLVAVPLVAMLLATTVIAAGPKKPYATDISPDTVVAGRCFTYEVFIENQTKTQQLGSANYTLDSDFGVNATTTGDCQLDPTITAGGSTLADVTPDPTNDHVLRLRDLSLAPGTPGGRVTFTFNATSDCPPGTSPYVNSIVAKQANNYSGDPGNDMTRDGTPFDTDVAVAGTCSDDPQSLLSQPGTDGSSYSIVSNGAGDGVLVLASGYDTMGAECEALGYTPHTDTVTADLLHNSTDTKTLTLVFKNVNNEPKSSFRFCYDPDEGGPLPTAIAVDCATSDPIDSANVPLCVLSVDQTKKTITMKVLLKPGDLKGRG